MYERMEVFVNGRKISLYRGFRVKHALIAFDERTYRSALAGKTRVVDEHGFALGLEGELTGGERIIAGTGEEG